MTSDKIDIELEKLANGVGINNIGGNAFSYQVAMWALTILISRTLIEILRNLENGPNRKD